MLNQDQNNNTAIYAETFHVKPRDKVENKTKSS